MCILLLGWEPKRVYKTSAQARIELNFLANQKGKRMENKVNIRNEKPEDYEIVERITREAFYNMYIPGCVEHYLVHTMRGHEDFIPELDFVLEYNGEVIGNIMYTKAKLVDENGEEKEILTFGPLCVLPRYQRKGYGKMLIEYSSRQAVELGYDDTLEPMEKKWMPSQEEFYMMSHAFVEEEL